MGEYASAAAYDLNADGRADLVIGRPDGTLAAAYGEAGGTFTAPAALTAGGAVLRGAAPLAAAWATSPATPSPTCWSGMAPAP
ncbi:FG-GAP repeat domain-containing protein [Paenibacillus mucilaginosus]|uniref:FG-GAP repeat domain-containing protein n=1 Tax=Paenibacillus mucilaginosus TaxID=61624 RepID=UPI00240D8CE3|nr:VCBS repeat-containing protein [Paenibacillus mucilaginosus]